MEKEKVERTVVHVELFVDNSHHYLPFMRNSAKKK